MELEEDEVVVKVVKMALAASGGPPHFYKQRFWWYFLLTILGVLCWLSILVECSGDIKGKFFSKVKLSLVNSTIFEFSRQNLDT